MTAPEAHADVGSRVKIVVGIGNPGPQYEATRHNVGWWVLDRFAHDRGLGPFERRGRAWEASGDVAGRPMRLLKPRTYVNRSGLALGGLWREPGFEAGRDLLVVADDANLPVGRIRLRPRGGSGGHNGLKSVSGALGTQDYARLRVGVGERPPGVDLADWVLSPMPAEDEEAVADLLPELSAAVGAWAQEGPAAAMNQFNR